MTTDTQKHPFLDDLAEEVVLVSSVLRRPVQGRDAVLKIVKAGARQYATQKPTFLVDVTWRRYFEYDLTLHGGLKNSGLVSIRHDADGKVVGLEIAFTPLDVVLSIAAGVRDAIDAELSADRFLRGVT